MAAYAHERDTDVEPDEFIRLPVHRARPTPACSVVTVWACCA
jgi:hypothetical protein